MKPTTIATASAAGGVSGAVVVIATWALGLAHITVPAEVAAAMMVCATPVLHLVAVRIGAEPKDVPAAPAPAPATAG